MENITPPMPAKRALAVLDQPPPAADIGAPKRISPKVRAAIDAMVTGECKNITEAAAKVGLARESLSRALSTHR
jgi:transposase-like protein